MNSNARCIAHLQSGGLVLAPDLRQARILRRLHDRAQVAAGRRAWPTAQVLPLESWLLQLWQRATNERTELPTLLSPVALQWLWSLEVQRDAPGLLDSSDLGARARASWLKLRAHGGDLASVARWPLTRDQHAFLAWSGRVESRLHELASWDGGDLARLLVESSALPGQGPPILLAGFRRLTPVQAALFAALAAAGHAIERLHSGAATGVCFRHRSLDPASEQNEMLAWLSDRVATAPEGLHALIVRDLDVNRGALERALAASLQPATELPGSERIERVFDLAGGNALAAQPVVDAALAALACAVETVDWKTASRLLRSEYLAGSDVERSARITTELLLREPQGSLQLRGSQLAALAARGGATQFSAAIRAALAAIDGPRRRSAGAWAEALGTGLAAWGWAGGAAPGSHDFQAARRFGELLRELALLGSVAGEIEASVALAELRRLAAAPFQPESGEPVVFVLDAREVLGVQLDSLWVAGLTATAWPRPAAVDPLLPIDGQRSLGMPGVTPEDCVAEARAIVADWRSGAGVLVLSAPQFENDTEADATPLMPADAVALAAGTSMPSRERLAFDARRFEALPETALPPLANAHPRGGARVLELQALCPFRALAELRLGAAPLEEPAAGIDRRLRGITLHRALQGLWSGLGTRSALARLDEGAQRARIHAVVDAALAAVIPPETPAAAIGLEREWQCLSIGQLVALDLARPEFAVMETERPLSIAVGGLELRLRVDRVDRVGDECVVIDYKTGKAASTAWRGARMGAPQLPLYAVLHPDRPTGIAIARVGAAGAKYSGVGRDEAAFAGMKAAEKFELTEDRLKGFDWPAITAHWRAWLEKLAADFSAGRSDVDPKLGAATCRQCHLSTLCRVEAAAPDDLGPEDDDDE